MGKDWWLDVVVIQPLLDMPTSPEPIRPVIPEETWITPVSRLDIGAVLSIHRHSNTLDFTHAVPASRSGDQWIRAR